MHPCLCVAHGGLDFSPPLICPFEASHWPSKANLFHRSFRHHRASSSFTWWGLYLHQHNRPRVLDCLLPLFAPYFLTPAASDEAAAWHAAIWYSSALSNCINGNYSILCFDPAAQFGASGFVPTYAKEQIALPSSEPRIWTLNSSLHLSCWDLCHSFSSNNRSFAVNLIPFPLFNVSRTRWILCLFGVLSACSFLLVDVSHKPEDLFQIGMASA